MNRLVYVQARWDEPSIMQLSQTGKVGFHQMLPDDRTQASLESIPKQLRRAQPPSLPEVSEIEVVRHYTRLSQENFGVDLGIYPLGSCTMKYNPKICDAIAASHKIQELHPYQTKKQSKGFFRSCTKHQTSWQRSSEWIR